MKYENNKIVYEVGDWVVYEREGLKAVAPISCVGENIRLDINVCHKSVCWSAERFRPATQEEIDIVLKEDKIFIGELEVKFRPDVTSGVECVNIGVGCQNINKDLFLKIGKKAGWL